nr:MAG TPA: hypothetical protein [Caudoviricetes sp.]
MLWRLFPIANCSNLSKITEVVIQLFCWIPTPRQVSLP